MLRTDFSSEINDINYLSDNFNDQYLHRFSRSRMIKSQSERSKNRQCFPFKRKTDISTSKPYFNCEQK